MKMKMPKGFKTPEGVKPGEEFDVVATVTMSDDGSLTVKALDGAPLEGGEKPTEEKPMGGGETEGETPEDAAEEDTFVDSIMAAVKK